MEWKNGKISKKGVGKRGIFLIFLGFKIMGRKMEMEMENLSGFLLSLFLSQESLINEI